MAQRNERQPWFANVDLNICGRKGQRLETLVHELEKFMHVISDDAGSNRVTLEMNGMILAAEPTLLQMARVVQKLSPAARKVWQRCKIKCFSIGVNAEYAPHCAVFPVSNNVLQAVANCGAMLDICVYAPPKQRSANRQR